MKRFSLLHLSPVAVTLLAGILLLSSSAMSGELLPFPSSSPEKQRSFQPAQQVAPRESSFQKAYKEKIYHFNCPQLTQLRERLVSKINNSKSPKESRYYFSQVEVVDELREEKLCP